MLLQLIFEMLLLLSAVDLESPEHQNKEVLQWENARTEIKQAKETKIYGDVGTYILYLIFFTITETFVDKFFLKLLDFMILNFYNSWCRFRVTIYNIERR